jgi:hypothetical protein
MKAIIRVGARREKTDKDQLILVDECSLMNRLKGMLVCLTISVTTPISSVNRMALIQAPGVGKIIEFFFIHGKA